MASRKKTTHPELNRHANPFPPGVTPPGAVVWQPGQSGNPRGFSKKARMTKLINEFLSEVDPYDQDGKTRAQKVIDAVYRVATEGKGIALVNAANLLIERVDGKVPLEVAGDFTVRQKLAQALDIPEAELLKLEAGDEPS